ncbi:MAG: heavy-metal-associated domain-containing protein [Cytophaga sp.]|uniref:heavy-metal-associated domain-containing protein n=1 Tax=Cytophaga sp. TaxID=29535 RepID=UPI003F7EEF85
MKTIIFSMILMCVSIFQNTFATEAHYETTSFKVSGNCDMCKSRIESALKKNPGVQSAIWDVKTKTVTISYNPHAISVDQLHKIIADAGHDTDKIKATDTAYKALPGCCKYKRG